MVEYKSLRVPEDAWEEAKAQKEDADRTWGDQIVRPDGDGDTQDVQLGAGYQEIAEKIGAAMDTEQIDEKTLAEYVADYLVAEADLPRKVAEEVRE